MAASSFMVANPQAIYIGEPAVASTEATTEIIGGLDDAQLTEADPEETVFKALIGGVPLKINKTLGDISLTLTLVEVHPDIAKELTGYEYTAPTSEAAGHFRRPAKSISVEKMIVIEFEGGIKLVLNRAEISAKIADMDVATGLMGFQLTCVAKTFVDGANKYVLDLELPALA